VSLEQLTIYLSHLFPGISASRLLRVHAPEGRLWRDELVAGLAHVARESLQPPACAQFQLLDDCRQAVEAELSRLAATWLPELTAAILDASFISVLFPTLGSEAGARNFSVHCSLAPHAGVTSARMPLPLPLDLLLFSVFYLEASPGLH